MTRILAVVLGSFLIAASAGLTARQDMPADYAAVLKTLGKAGDFKDNALKVNLPRNDLRVTINGQPVAVAFGFGGWLAFTKGDAGHDVMMGDLVLTEDEVNPVLSAVLANGLEATALHNHFFWENPRIFYMHVHGHGAAADLANRVKPAVDAIGSTPQVPANSSLPSPAPFFSSAPDLDPLATIIGHAGEKAGTAIKFTIGRPDIQMREMGALINARMGLNTWAAFVGTNADAMVAGDVAMLEGEVTRVLKALRAHNLSVVAMHHHMIGARPVVIFLHYWGRGRARDLATGVRAALDELGK